MAVTFEELIQGETQETIRNLILSILTVAGFPISAWQPGSLPLLIVDALAEVLADAFLVVTAIARGGYGKTARGKWFWMWLEDRFQLTQILATYTAGTVLLTDAGGGPHNIGAGALLVSTPDGKRFASTANVTVPLNGSATVDVTASGIGSAYNVPNGAITELVTTFPSLSVTNPPISGSDTWITSAGRDDETEAEGYARGTAQWSNLSVATPAGYLANVAKAAAPAVTKVYVRDDNPHGPGSVELVLATGAGPASAGDVILVNSALQEHRARGSGTISAVSAAAVNVTVPGTVYCKAANLSASRSKFRDELAAYQARLDIGASVLGSQIVKFATNQEGVRDFDPVGDVLSDTPVGELEVATLTDGTTWVAE